MKTCRKDFQGRKSTAVLKLLCRNIATGRFNWRRYCTPQTYFGQEIALHHCTVPMAKSATPCISLTPTCRKWNMIGKWGN